MTDLGRILIILGALLIILGILLIFGFNFSFLGKLPGDIYIKKGNFRFYFPIITALLISLFLTLVLNLIFRLIKR